LLACPMLSASIFPVRIFVTLQPRSILKNCFGLKFCDFQNRRFILAFCLRLIFTVNQKCAIKVCVIIENMVYTKKQLKKVSA